MVPKNLMPTCHREHGWQVPGAWRVHDSMTHGISPERCTLADDDTNILSTLHDPPMGA